MYVCMYVCMYDLLRNPFKEFPIDDEQITFEDAMTSISPCYYSEQGASRFVIILHGFKRESLHRTFQCRDRLPLKNVHCL